MKKVCFLFLLSGDRLLSRKMNAMVKNKGGNNMTLAVGDIVIIVLYFNIRDLNESDPPLGG